MGAAKNILMGVLYAAIALISFVILPWTGLSVVKNLELNDVTINYARFNIDRILFFIQSLGIVQVGIAFGRGSSPKYSKRRALFSLAQVIGSGVYVYIIRFSGLSQIPITLENIGEITIIFDNMMYMAFGIILINGLLSIFDLIISIKDQKDGTVYSLDKEFKEARAEMGTGGMYE